MSKLELNFTNSDVPLVKRAYGELLKDLKNQGVIEDYDVFTEGCFNNQIQVHVVKKETEKSNK